MIDDNDLNELRRQINQLDNQILNLMEARFEVVKKVRALKKRKGLPIRDLEREEEVIGSKVEKTDLPEDFVRRLYRMIIETAVDMGEEK